jgi:glycosyltransferase involved in cell wall biosynthesis
MKILHVNSTTSGGGLEQYLSQLFRELKQRGHRNLLLYGDRAVARTALTNVETIHIDGITQTRCEDLSAKLVAVQKILDTEDPDLIFIHQVLNASLIDLLTRKKPSVRFAHGFKLVCPEGKKTLKEKEELCPFPLSYRCEVRAYCYRCMPRNPFLGLPLIHGFKKIARIHKNRSHVVVASRFMESVLIANGFKKSKIRVIPYFTYVPETGTRSTSVDEPIIFSLGRIVPEKGMHHLLRAFRLIHREARLVIAGDGPALTALKTLSDKLEISPKVSFPGWLSRAELHKYYSKCALVVAPSLWPEPFGIVGIEAMAYQKPVVAFDTGGISEWLADRQTGYLVPKSDEAGLAQRIELLLERPDLADYMGKQGRQVVKERFVPEIHLDHLLPLFYDAVDSFPGPS